MTEHAPSLRFLAPQQRAELAPSDAKKIGVQSGDRSRSARARSACRPRWRCARRSSPAACSCWPGTLEDNGTALANGSPRVVDVRRIESEQRSPLAVVAAGGPDAEPPPS